MSRRLSLLTALDEAPRVDAVRRTLGGRARGRSGAGELVRFGERTGVVLFASDTHFEVWVEPGVVHHVAREDAVGSGRPPSALGRIAEDARAFASLEEGARVRVSTERGAELGTLIEKCRFGAIVERADGTLVGVGFRKIAAASPPS